MKVHNPTAFPPTDPPPHRSAEHPTTGRGCQHKGKRQHACEQHHTSKYTSTKLVWTVGGTLSKETAAQNIVKQKVLGFSDACFGIHPPYVMVKNSPPLLSPKDAMEFPGATLFNNFSHYFSVSHFLYTSILLTLFDRKNTL